MTVVASLLPHGMKLAFNQTRPDRLTVLGHVHGISFSGKRDDAFPSGHALHMGALGSAASAMPPGPRKIAYAIAIGLSLTRVVVLAHWASDVIAGFRWAYLWSVCSGSGQAITRQNRTIGIAIESRVVAMEYVLRFAVGGLFVSAFALLGDLLRPKSFAGLSERLPRLHWRHSALPSSSMARTTQRTRASMIYGAIALVAYSIAVCHVLMRTRLTALPATILALLIWLLVALSAQRLLGGL